MPTGSWFKDRISIPVEQAVLVTLAVQSEHGGAGESDLHGGF